MITLFHGDDEAASRNAFLAVLKKENTSILAGDTLTLTQLVEALEGSELFQTSKKIFIENLLQRRQSHELDDLINYLAKENSTHEIYLWEAKEIPKAKIAKLKTVTAKPFSHPKTVFAFLENIKPNNPETSIKLFHEALSTSEPEIIFSLLVRQFRLFLASLSRSALAIDEWQRLAPWQQQRIQKQAGFFDETKLIKHYTHLSFLDQKSKSGGLPLPLDPSIDFFLLNL